MNRYFCCLSVPTDAAGQLWPVADGEARPLDRRPANPISCFFSRLVVASLRPHLLRLRSLARSRPSPLSTTICKPLISCARFDAPHSLVDDKLSTLGYVSCGGRWREKRAEDWGVFVDYVLWQRRRRRRWIQGWWLLLLLLLLLSSGCCVRCSN